MTFKNTRYLILIIVVTAYIFSFFHRIAPGTISLELQKAFNANGAELGNLAATYFYIYTIMQIPTGVLADTLGPRKILTFGGIMAGIGSIVFALADSLFLAGIGRTLVGLGVSVTFISMLKLNAIWYKPEQFATVTGVSVFIGNLGAILSATPLAIAVTYYSWRDIFIVVGILSLILGILSWIKVRNYPEESGFEPVNIIKKSDGHIDNHWKDDLKIVFKNKFTHPGTLVTFGLSGSYFTFIGLWGTPYLMNVYHYSKPDASNHISMILLGFTLGSVLVGWLSDRLKNRKKITVSFSMSYFIMLWIILYHLPTAYGLNYILCFFFGLASSSFTLSWSCAKEVNPPHLSGMATSVVNAGAFLSTAMLQPLIGKILDITNKDYQSAFVLLLIMAGIGLIGAFLIKETHCRNIYNEL